MLSLRETVEAGEESHETLLQAAPIRRPPTLLPTHLWSASTGSRKPFLQILVTGTAGDDR